MLSINQLPYEILDKIFKFLSYPQLSLCANVCRRWNSIITNSRLLTFDIAKETEVSGCSFRFDFVPNLTAICLLLKHDRDVFQITQKFIELQGTTLEKVILDSSPNVDHDQRDDPERIGSHHLGNVDLIYQLTNLSTLSDLIINFPVPVSHEFNDKAYQLLHHLSLDISASSESYCHTCGKNARLLYNLLKCSGASIQWLSEYPINSPQVEIDYSKLKIFSNVKFLSLRTNMFDQNSAKKLFILFPNITKLELHAWTYHYSELIEMCVQYKQLTHLKIRIWACIGIKYERYNVRMLLVNDSIINQVCRELQNLTSLDLHGHLDLTDQSLEAMNQNNSLVSIRLTDGSIPFHKVRLNDTQTNLLVQFSEDALLNFAKKHPLLEQLELYVGQTRIFDTFLANFTVNCPRMKMLKFYRNNDTRAFIELLLK